MENNTTHTCNCKEDNKNFSDKIKDVKYKKNFCNIASILIASATGAVEELKKEELIEVELYNKIKEIITIAITLKNMFCEK